MYRFIVLLITCCAVIHSAWAVPAKATDVDKLIQQLKGGGYVIYLRHAKTNHDQIDQQQPLFDDCSTQRNLSEQGRAQARAIGAAFKDAKIPVQRVISSPYCRCVDTAKLAFGFVETSDDLRFAMRADKKEEQRLGTLLRGMLSTKPAANSNTILVAHTANLKSAAQLWPKPEGVAMVFKPLEDGGFQFIGKVLPEQWPQAAP